jgi:MSHA type pilus biogenesis protein MshL
LGRLAGCVNKDPLDGKLGYERLHQAARVDAQQLKDTREQEQKNLEQKAAPPEQALEPVAPTFNPLDDTLVSITMRDQPLNDVLFLVARNAGLNLVVDPGVNMEQNRVTISFESAKSSAVLGALLKAYDLSWEVKDNILHVRRFVEKTFDIGFLNVKSSMDIKHGGDILGTVDTSNTQSTGSNQYLRASSSGSSQFTSAVNVETSLGKGTEDNSLYKFLLTNVSNIINENKRPDLGHSAATITKTVTLEPQHSGPQTQSVAQTQIGGAAMERPDTQSPINNGYYTIDPVAGTLFVKTTASKMEAIANVLKNVQRKLNRQVVIDARILEVSLTDEFRFGIDWNYVAKKVIGSSTLGLNVGWSGTSSAPVLTIPNSYITSSKNAPSVSTQSGMAVPRGTDAVDATVEALQTFGGVRVVSNPHVRARHGLPTLFTSGTSLKYIDRVEQTQTGLGSSTQVTWSVKPGTAFDGIMLGVLPHVNDDGAADIQVFPIKSKVDRSSLAPVAVGTTGISVSMPIIDVKDVSTNIHVRSGDIIILGGLIDKSASNSDSGLPGLGKLPLVEWLFSTKDRSEVTRELVIIMDIQVLG